MKIAYVVPYVPNLIRTRPYNLITQLALLGHQVEVFTLDFFRWGGEGQNVAPGNPLFQVSPPGA